jgi:hypothetical protein
MSEHPTMAIKDRSESASDVAGIIAALRGVAPVPASGESGVVGRVKSGIETIVAAATIIYALGYLSWAFYAWDQNFGVAPALEGQYFGPGLVLAILLSLVGLTYYGLVLLLRISPDKRSVTHRRWKLSLQWTGTALIVLNLIAAKIIKLPALDPWAGIAGIGCFGVSWFFSTDKMDRVFARGTTWYLFAVAPIFVFALFQLFVTRVFAHLPSEFGGPAARAVQLDVKKTEVSAETMALLGAAPAAESEIVRTKVVRVVMKSGDLYVVRTTEGAGTAPVTIHVDAVRAIIPTR